MEVLNSFKNSPLARQVYESIKIVNLKVEDDIQINDKDEFNQAHGACTSDLITILCNLYWNLTSILLYIISHGQSL